MDSYVTYLQITSAESGRISLLQLPSSPHVSSFSSMDVVCCKCRCGDLGFYIGVGSLPPPAGR